VFVVAEIVSVEPLGACRSRARFEVRIKAGLAKA
jgi:hypothetical protein